MRVLQILEASLAGTRRYLADVAHALGDGEQCGLVYSLHRADSSFLPLLAKLRAAGWHLYELDMQRDIDLRRDGRNVRELRRIYRRFKPDVVHAHASKAGALARLAGIGLAQRPAVVYSPHSITATRSRLAFVLEKLLARRLDILAAVTASEREELLRLRLVPEARVCIIVPTISGAGVGAEERASARRRIGIPSNPIVVAVGRLVAQKDPLEFVELVARLRDSIPNIRAFWIGDGELRADIELLIARHRLESSFVLTGWLEDVRTHLAACDVLVSVAKFESFGYATAEALAAERPVVASSVVGTIDVVTCDRELQLFLRPHFQHAARQVESFLSDPTLAAAVGQRGRQAVTTTYSADQTRRDVENAYAAADALRTWCR